MLLPVIDILKIKWLDPVFILVSRVHNLNRKESFFVQLHAQMATFSKWFFFGFLLFFFGGGVCVFCLGFFEKLQEFFIHMETSPLPVKLIISVAL